MPRRKQTTINLKDLDTYSALIEELRNNPAYSDKDLTTLKLTVLDSYETTIRGQSEKTQTATGILLYPTVDEDYDLHYRYGTHDIQIRTINLNTNWRNLFDRLMEIINLYANYMQIKNKREPQSLATPSVF